MADMTTPEGMAGTILQSLADFLAFRTFITPGLLLVVYYLGALGIPVLVWWYVGKLHTAVNEFSGAAAEGAKKIAKSASQMRGSFRLRLTALLIFLGAELLWRVMIEVLMAYFDIRQALVLGS